MVGEDAAPYGNRLREALREQLVEVLTRDMPPVTRRDVRLPAVPGKALAVIGVRRSGKTTFLWQLLADRLAAGHPRESLILIGFEDDRLAGAEVADVAWLIEEYYRRHPEWRGRRRVTLCLDEIQIVPGWETLVRRLIDTEQIDIVVSGSSAAMLSREVASSMRGRGLEVVVTPFSFRETLRHTGLEPKKPWRDLPRAARSELENRLRRYLLVGGFPEVQGLNEFDRLAVLRSYVDLVVLRDVIDRHEVSNPVALRWLQRQLLSTPGGAFSVNRFYNALRSQGLPVAKDTLHAYLGYFEDAFLVRTVSLHAASERQRMANPRKAYPIDPGLIQLYERHGRENLGHALETAVLLDFDRRGYEVSYVRTDDQYEVDFCATRPGEVPWLVQVALDVSDPTVCERELRPLSATEGDLRRAKRVVVTLDGAPPRRALPADIALVGAAEWLLRDDETRPARAEKTRSPAGRVRAQRGT